ncbi:MAG: hypothetical protein ACTHMP_26645 [Thermomicrobiales bacterium]
MPQGGASTHVVANRVTVAGCPTQREAIGPTGARLQETDAAARQIRRRYTVPALAYEAGLLPELVDELFAPGAFWSPLAACGM